MEPSHSWAPAALISYDSFFIEQVTVLAQNTFCAVGQLEKDTLFVCVAVLKQYLPLVHFDITVVLIVVVQQIIHAYVQCIGNST